MAPTLFKILLVAVCLFALLRGGREERLVAIMCGLGTLATMIVLSPLGDRYDSVEYGVVFIDLAMFAGFTAVALRSYRFWPLWVAGLQLTTMMGHLFKTIDTDLLPQAYAASLLFWSYPILLILAVGTWRHWRQAQLEGNGSPLPG